MTISEFNQNLNISYIDQNLPSPNNSLIIKHCITSIVLYTFIYIFLLTNPFFKNYFNQTMQHIYTMALIIYTIFAPILYLKFKPKSIYKSHSIEIFNYLKRLTKIDWKNSDYQKVLDGFKPTYYESQSIMLIFIKVFFGTLMTSFFINDYNHILQYLEICNNIFSNLINYDFFAIKNLIFQHSTFFYKFAVLILFTVDVGCFAIGYLTEATFLKNKIRAVETSFLGIFFCLICYPPFNSVTTAILGWNQNDNTLPLTNNLINITWILKLLGLIFLVIYVSASLALGTKASNLTNRGIVSKFPYNIVRHPAYISKNIFWLLTTIPLLFVDFNSSKFIFHEYLFNLLLILLSWFIWFGIYYFRAIFEEKFLMQDPDYQEYAKKVKYRFIPYIM